MSDEKTESCIHGEGCKLQECVAKQRVALRKKRAKEKVPEAE
jgi:hypothetical protein